MKPPKRQLTDTPLMSYSSDLAEATEIVSKRLYKQVNLLVPEWELNEFLTELKATMDDKYPDVDPDSVEYVDLAMKEII